LAGVVLIFAEPQRRRLGMIEAFSLKTAHLFGDALLSQARLRHRVFVEHRALDHPSYDGMEYDRYDTPAAVYLVWRDPQRVVRGLIRLVPTSLPYMTEQNWPFLCQRRPLPKSGAIWESSRVCVDKTYIAAIRKRIMPEMLCGVHEFCLHNGYEAVIGVTRKHLLEHYLPGKLQWLGPTAEVEGEQEAAFYIPTQDMRPHASCSRLGIPERVLSFEPVSQEAAA
jgi:acyl homoserine lactone synthase